MNKVLLSSGKDDWETPQEFFAKLDREFQFTLDPCANDNNHKCNRYYTELDDGLSKSWGGETVFCNPPYSAARKGKPGQADWIKKCYDESKKPGTTVVMLIPARTDTAAFHKYIYGKAEIRFVRGRLKFVGAKYSAPFPSMVVVYRGGRQG